MTNQPLRRCLALLTAAALLLCQEGPALLWAAESALLEGVEVGADEVAVHLTSRVKFNTFVTSNPPRLVIEFLDTEFTASERQQGGKGSLLKGVRSGQYQRTPSMITRIVLDLLKEAAYTAKWEDNKLLVSLTGASGDSPRASPVDAALVEPAAHAPNASPDEAQGRVAAAPQAPKPAAPKPAAPAALKDAPNGAAAKPALPVAQVPTSLSTEVSSELRAIAEAGDARPEDADAPAAAASVKPLAAPAGKKKLRRDILAALPSDPVTLEYDDMDIRDMLKLMGLKAKINIVYGSDVNGNLSLHLKDVPYNEAFMTILSMQGLVASQVGENILRVMTPSTLTKERGVAVNQTRIVRLKYAKALDVKTAVDAVVTAQKRTPSIVTDENTNSLIITDTLDGIDAIERLISEIDIRPQQVMIEAKLVEVVLSKGVDFGVQWDYLGMENSKIGTQTGSNMFGTASHPLTTALVKPLDQNADATAGTGGVGRGTGVNLPASNIFGAFTFGRVTNNYFLSATLTAAASEGKAKVLSDPKISTVNGKQALIKIETSIPFTTTETTPAGGGSVTTATKQSFQKTGITLDVKPTINADGRITLEIKPKVEQASPNTAASATGARQTDSRSAETTVVVQDGGTVVIGGLITDSVSDSISKVPFFGDIPLLGWLFKKKSTTRNRVELLIFVTTRIIPS
ncbi:MAG: type IV pilus secretin PilQ [Elusimicrobiota bacterium]